jgi:hypothetical protein
MIEKEHEKNQSSLPSPVSPGLRADLGKHAAPDGRHGNGGARRNSGRPKGVPNKITQTFRDVLLQAVSEVGSSREVGKDGRDGLLAYLKVAAVSQEKTTLLLLGRILPLKITTEVREIKEKMTIHEAVADLKACGLDPLLALYLQRYPIGPDEENTEWAEGVDTTIDTTFVDVTPEKDVTPKEIDTENHGS